MAKVEKKIIDKNKLYFGKVKAEDFFYGREEVKRICYGREVKFNRAMYYIELSDTALQVHPSGINLYEMLGPNISRKRDLADDVVSDVSYTIDAPVIEPNEDETKGRSGFFIVTQDESISGLTLQGSWEQAKDYLSFIGVRLMKFSDLQRNTITVKRNRRKQGISGIMMKTEKRRLGQAKATVANRLA